MAELFFVYSGMQILQQRLDDLRIQDLELM